MDRLDIARTFGALLVGGIVAAMLVFSYRLLMTVFMFHLSRFSGIVTSQTFAYFKNYPKDEKGIKLLVGELFLRLLSLALLSILPGRCRVVNQVLR